MILSPSASALAVGGGLWSRSDQLNNAQREASARNGVLSTAINGLNQDYNNINAPAFSGPGDPSMDPSNAGSLFDKPGWRHRIRECRI